MTATLVTFLGRPARSDRGEYRRIAYDFGDGNAVAPAAFFGWPLANRLKLERIVILGTAGSAWDHLLEADHDFGDAREEQRLALAESVESRAVTPRHLDALQELLCERTGMEVHAKLIPYCRSDAEQVELLRTLAEHVGQGDDIHLDVTHGFRTLPMLSLLAALYLRRVRRARVAGIWYGGFDPDTGDAPVQNLTGLLEVADWLEALAVYDHTGDYAPAGRLLRDHDMAAALARASFLEQINDLGAARGQARKVLRGLDEISHGSPSFSLFRDELSRRLAWAREDRFYRRQRQLALERLARGQFHSAILAGQEAFVSRLLLRHGGGDPHNQAQREAAQAAFESVERTANPRSELYRAWDELRRLRNAIAHGSRPRGSSVQRAMSDEPEMRAFLDRLFATLLPERDEQPDAEPNQ